MDDADAARLQNLASAFIAAGADILVAPTDAICLIPNVEHAPSGKIEPASSKIVTCLKSTIPAESGRPIEVWAAMGPVEHLIVLSEIDETALTQRYRDHASALAAAGAQGLICRSFTELELLVLAVRSAREATNLPVIGSMVFDSGADYTQTVMGVSIPQAAVALMDAGAAYFGCNDSEFPDGAPAVVTLMKESCSLPLYIEVTPGRAEISDAGIIYPESPKAFGERFDSLAAAGARIIAGSRGASPAHISEIAKAAARSSRRKGATHLG